MTASSSRLLAGRRFHMLGIGGAGVSALAQLAHAWGAEVGGCDRADSAYARLVREAGVPVHLAHAVEHVDAGHEVVVSSAVPEDHPELVRARELDCRVVLRGELLGELTRLRDTVVVAGAHGKSTTTAMIAHAAVRCGLDPSVALGATSAQLGGNVRASGADLFVVEGDESDRTLLALAARIAVVTNIERDHHHTFGSDDEVEELFATWVASLPSDATLVAGPGAACDRLVATVGERHVVRFGLDEEQLAAVGARLVLPGRHNALNAAAAASVLELLGVEQARAVDALGTFSGIGRRFELVGTAGGARVVDDYAHHPTEVRATVQAAREQAGDGRVLVVFQPHLYSRTAALWAEFAGALGGADRVWILPIHGAREDPIEGVDARLISRELDRVAPGVCAGVIESGAATDDVATIIEDVRPSDTLITMGAGSVTELAPRILAALETTTGSGRRDAAPPRAPRPRGVELDVPLSRFTTIGTGGTARLFARVGSEEHLVQLLTWAADEALPIALVGLGSNSLVADEGFDGLALRLVDGLAAIDVDVDGDGDDGARAGGVVLGGGASLAAAVRLCRDAGLTGFEFACAIPGTAGGALRMNAGAYGGEMRDVLVRARLASARGVREVGPEALGLRYRHSDVLRDEVVTRVEIALGHDDPAVIKARVREMQARRSASQPRAARSFGSVFRNPGADDEAEAGAADAPGEQRLGAGSLIEQAGLKGHQVGGARISPVHGNFIENVADATTADVIELMLLAQRTVRELFGVNLQPEVHLLGSAGYRPLAETLAEQA